MSQQGVRIDKWLWAARFYKMRGLATAACKGGHISMHSLRCKASKLVQIGEIIQIQKEQEYFTVKVLALTDKRGSATLAQGLYEETQASVQSRQQQAERRKLQKLADPLTSKRPDKRQRRQIQSFKGR